MAAIEWIAGNVVGTTVADNTAMASRAAGYYNIAQVSGADMAAIDNATNLDEYLALTILLGSWTPAVTDSIEAYLLYAPDGTNYESGSSSFLPPADRLWRSRLLSTDTSAAAKRVVMWGPILPFKFKVLWRWRGTNSTASSGNSMVAHTFNEG